jgi:hypothetical protein
MDSLPNDILDLIFDNIFDIKSFFSIARTCKLFYNLSNQERRYDYLLQCQHITIPQTSINSKEAMKLYCCFGCEFCKRLEFRTIYKKFVTIYIEFNVRCCKQCLYEQIINEFFFKSDENNSIILRNCRYKNVMFFGGRRGVTVYKCYWKKDIQNANIAYLQYYIAKKKIKIDINDIINLSDFKCIYKPISKKQTKYFISLFRKKYICFI